MLTIPRDAPQTLEEYEYLVNAVYQNGLEQYELDRANAQEQAEYQWDAQAETIREKLIAEMEANLAAITIDMPDGPRHLSEAEWQARWNDGIREIDATLAKDRERHIEQALSMVQQPRTRQDVEAMYSFYKNMWVQPDMPDFPQAPATLEEVKIAKINEVDAQISENIKAGFEYALDGGETLYYSLSEIDQINLANYANAAILLIQSGKEGKIRWQAWDKPDHVKGDMPLQVDFSPEDFISLYTQGALTHIQNCLSQGRAVKYEILAATTKEEVASLNVEPTQIVKARNG